MNLLKNYFIMLLIKNVSDYLVLDVADAHLLTFGSCNTGVGFFDKRCRQY